MTQSQLGKIWFVISAFLLYYTLNSWLVTQGGQEIFGAKLVVAKRVPAAIIAILICSVLLILASRIGRLYALRSGPSWHARVPVVGFDAIDTGSREGKIYQRAMLFFFSILPIAGLIHFWFIVSSAKVLPKGSGKSTGIWDWSALTTLNDPARICSAFTEGQAGSCADNVTILPLIEPAAFLLLTLVALVAVIAHWRTVFRP
ncbi:hypothetical protein [Agrobacterium tumefaciens]|uniref:hypothetical protein n=1 Tax=Agrobacterium tumefaciens TaxID=358 RepID=UPI00122FCD22